MRDLSFMTWKEIKEVDKKGSVVFVVMAPIEEHGWCLPLATDIIEGENWSRGAMKLIEEKSKIRCYYLPTFPIAAASVNAFYGSVHFSMKTTFEVAYEILDSVRHMGFENIVIIAPHAVGQENIYVALDENEKCLGFIYYMTNGVFGSYPYLHIVAVKEEYRNYGIGKQLIKFFEDNASDSSSAKYFLTVDDFNPGAKILYENLGYNCVGELPDFYKKTNY